MPRPSFWAISCNGLYMTWYRTTSRHIRLTPMGRETAVFPISSHLETEYLSFLYKMYQFSDESLVMTHLAIRHNARKLYLRPCAESRGSSFHYIAYTYTLVSIHQWYYSDFEQKNYCRHNYFLTKVSSKLIYFISFLQFQLSSFQPKLFS